MSEQQEPTLWPFPKWEYDEQGNFRMVRPREKPETKREKLERLADEVGEAKF